MSIGIRKSCEEALLILSKQTRLHVLAAEGKSDQLDSKERATLINRLDYFGNTPLMSGLISGKLDRRQIVQLIQDGTDLRIPNQHGIKAISLLSIRRVLIPKVHFYQSILPYENDVEAYTTKELLFQHHKEKEKHVIWFISSEEGKLLYKRCDTSFLFMGKKDPFEKALESITGWEDIMLYLLDGGWLPPKDLIYKVAGREITPKSFKVIKRLVPWSNIDGLRLIRLVTHNDPVYIKELLRLGVKDPSFSPAPLLPSKFEDSIAKNDVGNMLGIAASAGIQTYPWKVAVRFGSVEALQVILETNTVDAGELMRDVAKYMEKGDLETAIQMLQLIKVDNRLLGYIAEHQAFDLLPFAKEIGLNPLALDNQGRTMYDILGTSIFAEISVKRVKEIFSNV